MTSDYKEKFKNISTFLKEYEYLHEKEFIKKYPRPYPKEILPWIEELRTLHICDIAKLESFPSEERIKDHSFKCFLEKVRNLSSVRTLEVEEVELPQNFKRKLSPKKKHEIQKIRGLMDKAIKCETIVDVGGGAGHLSSSLVYKNNMTSLCIDMDERLQEAGKKRIKSLSLDSVSMNFIPLKFSENTEIENDFDPTKSLIIGLHSCGDLSSSLIKFGVNNNIKSILNFGCCYHKIENHLNISRFSKTCGLQLSKSALHLASRCGSVVTEAEIQKRLKQKKYRYTLHYLLYSFNKGEFKGVGNATPRDYSGSFYEYCLKFDLEGVLNSISREEIEEFYSANKLKVWDHYLADTIRLFLGRIIELYIVLDRAIFLQESGYHVDVHELFDRDLSPRNIMLKATPLL